MLWSLLLLTLAANAHAGAAAAAPSPQPNLAGLRSVLTHHGEEALHLAIVCWCTHNALQSVVCDEWAAIRLAPPARDVGRGIIFRKRRRAAKVGALLGTGYTPRIVFLAGLMLRSLQMSTRFHEVFDPSLGYAAGATLGARFSQREWIPCILLGWGFGGTWWSLFRVRPPNVARSQMPFKWH